MPSDDDFPVFWYGQGEGGYLVKVEVTELEKDFMRANLAAGGHRARAAARAVSERQYRLRINGEEYDAKADPDRLPTTTEPANVEILWASIASDTTPLYFDGRQLFRSTAGASA